METGLRATGSIPAPTCLCLNREASTDSREYSTNSKVSELFEKCCPYECVCTDYDKAVLCTCCSGASACVCCVLCGTDVGNYALKTFLSIGM